MRWMFVSSRHDPSAGGVGAYIAAAVDALTGVGWNVELVTRASDQLPVGARCHVIRTLDEEPSFNEHLDALRRMERIRPYRYGLWSLAVARSLMEIDSEPDVIEFVDTQAEGFVALNSQKVRRRFAEARLIVHAHTPMFIEENLAAFPRERFGRAIYHEWERRSLALADGIIAPSCLMGDRIEHPRCAVIPCPLPNCGEGADVIGREQEPLILGIGSVQPPKGFDVWAQSLNDVLRERQGARAMLIGPDTCGADGRSMVAEVRATIDAHLRDRFKWAGSLPHDQVRHFLRQARCVIVPSRFESFSYVAAEAIMSRVPVVMSDRVGIAEYLPAVRCVPIDDPHALASAQLSILRHRDLQATRVAQEQLMIACNAEAIAGQRMRFIDSLPRAADKLSECDADAESAMDNFLRKVESNLPMLTC